MVAGAVAVSGQVNMASSTASCALHCLSGRSRGWTRAHLWRRRGEVWQTRCGSWRRGGLFSSGDCRRRITGGRRILCSGYGFFLDSGRCRRGRDKGLVLGLCQQEKGAAKENADDCGSDETEQQEMERATDVKLLHCDTAAWRRG